MTQSPTGTPTATATARPPRFRRGPAGVALIIIGAGALLATATHSQLTGLLFLPLISAAFLAWGLTTRNAGPLIPGGILAGAGLGALLAQTTYAHIAEPGKDGIILLCLGLGFLVIIPLARSVGDRRQQWELLPSGILILLGAGLLVGGPITALLQFLGEYWPIGLIALGAYFLWQNARKTPVV